jgi:hypothetical protein
MEASPKSRSQLISNYIFLRSILRSGKILLQKHEILCNAVQMLNSRKAQRP